MTEVKERQFHVCIIATSIAVAPEKFQSGDFLRWLRDFDCCASGNGWNDERKLTVLPAFLQGQTFSYFHTLKGGEKDTCEHLTSALRKFFCPEVARKQHYLEQGSQTQFTSGPLEAVFECGRAAIGTPKKSSESILKCPY